MKKAVLLIIVSLSIMFGSSYLVGCNININDKCSDGLILVETTERRYEVVGYTGTDTQVVIPRTYNSKKVTSIANNVFYDCSNITSIEIPSSVRNIGDYAFYNCSSLESIEIPDNVTSIGNVAFHGCNRLKSIEIPTSMKSIGSETFGGCSSLTRIIIPDSVTSIGRNMFVGCKYLTIYCEARSKPRGWHLDWNINNAPVVWEYTG